MSQIYDSPAARRETLPTNVRRKKNFQEKAIEALLASEDLLHRVEAKRLKHRRMVEGGEEEETDLDKQMHEENQNQSLGAAGSNPSTGLSPILKQLLESVMPKHQAI